MCVFSPDTADEFFSKLLLKDQSQAFFNVKFEWFGDKIVPKISLRGLKYVDRWIETIHCWIDLNLFPYNFHNILFIKSLIMRHN
jgi:hypothetical protein